MFDEVNLAAVAVAAGSITELDVDVLVNAANSGLRGGGGVDGAIHAAAGPGLLAECRSLGGCDTGSAVLTRGHDLTAAHVIHAVGPVWDGGDNGEDALLRSAYRSVLRILRRIGATSVAFPAISCGVYRFPHSRATRIAVGEVLAHLGEDDTLRRVVFCCFDRQTRETYEQVLRGHGWRGAGGD